MGKRQVATQRVPHQMQARDPALRDQAARHASERINAISPADWETVIEGIVRGVEDWEPQYTAREQISIICRRLLDTRLVRAELVEEGLLCDLVGASDGPSPLTVWGNDGEGCYRREAYIDPFQGLAQELV